MSEETLKFKTEVQQLLHLMIHSLYSNRDIFLRELIANSADAIDKAKFESLTNTEINDDWEIRIETDKTKNILKISDNGIGMTRDEVIKDIGTIAQSGTKAYIESLQKKESKELPELIGQFGVGFYSAFMVAEHIILVSKRAGSHEPAVRWESKGETSYTITDDSRTEQGTTVILHLKPDCKEYLEEWKIKEIVKKYSDFIEHPIRIASKKKKGDESETIEYEVLNSQKALWLRPASEIKEEEYKNFYTHLSHFDNEPLSRIHYSAEGTSEFKALLYIPSKAPLDLLFPEQRRKGLHLYIKRVFITDECALLLPEYLRFIKGVVESNDLPLNISREMLQDNPQIRKIQKNLVKKILAELKRLQENETEKYLRFYREFGRILKEGVHLDSVNKDSIGKLLMFETMNGTDGSLVSLKQYVDAMPSEQKDIYCLTGESRAMLENSPHLESLRTKKYDVIFMTDPIDEWILNDLPEYNGKKIKTVGKGAVEFDEKEKEKAEEARKKHKSLLEYLKKTLEKDIKDVRFSSRLTESACCLVTEDFAPSPHMEKIFKAMNQEMPKMKRILELNPGHPLIEALQKVYEKSPKSPELAESAEMLYDQALLTEGIQLKDPLRFAKRVANLMVFKAEKELVS